jgi:dienelactone hydrolase
MRAKELAGKGFVVFVADLYGKAAVTKDPEIAKKWAGELYDKREVMRSRARAAVAVLKQQVNVDMNNIALVGFCFGGSAALELARKGDDVKGVAAIHSGLKFPERIDKGAVKTKVIVLNGGADPNVPFADRQAFIEEMQNSGADLQFVEFGGAVHAFTNPDADRAGIPGVAYNQKAERRAMSMLDNFLKEVFAR